MFAMLFKYLFLSICYNAVYKVRQLGNQCMSRTAHQRFDVHNTATPVQVPMWPKPDDVNVSTGRRGSWNSEVFVHSTDSRSRRDSAYWHTKSSSSMSQPVRGAVSKSLSSVHTVAEKCDCTVAEK